jgi:hypothetical protein
MGMNGLQLADGSDSERTAEVCRVADATEMLVKRRQRHRQRPIARIHYSRDSLRFRSFWWTQVATLEDSLAGWHGLLQSAGFRTDFVSDHELARVARGKDLLVLPFSLILDEPAVVALATSPARIFAGPHTGCADAHGHLRPTRLPPALSESWKVGFGLWHDVGHLPVLTGAGRVTGWRKLFPRSGTRTLSNLDKHTPFVVRHERVTIAAVDVGELWSRGTTAQRRAVVSRLGINCHR